MDKKQITIIGATGNLGAPVVKNLVSFGYKVKVVARDTDKAHKVFQNFSDVAIVKANLTSIESLKKALHETEYLYLNLSTTTTQRNIPFAPEREGIANILKAIDRQTIKQIISISGLGAFDNVSKPNEFKFVPNIIRKQGHKRIKDSGIPYTILHCSWFADSFVFYQRKGIYSVIGDTKNPIYFTNCFDFSRHLANAIGNKDAFCKEFPIQGKTGIRHVDAANEFLSVYSPKSKVKVLPTMLIYVLALFIKEMKFVKHMDAYFKSTPETFVAEDCQTYRVLGKPEMNLSGYAHKLKNEHVYELLNNDE